MFVGKVFIDVFNVGLDSYQRSVKLRKIFFHRMKFVLRFGNFLRRLHQTFAVFGDIFLQIVILRVEFFPLTIDHCDVLLLLFDLIHHLTQFFIFRLHQRAVLFNRQRLLGFFSFVELNLLFKSLKLRLQTRFFNVNLSFGTAALGDPVFQKTVLVGNLGKTIAPLFDIGRQPFNAFADFPFFGNHSFRGKKILQKTGKGVPIAFKGVCGLFG